MIAGPWPLRMRQGRRTASPIHRWRRFVQSEISSSNLEPLISKLEYRVQLDRADREAILALPFHAKVMKAHQYVVRERELASHSCLMLSGYSVRSKIVGSGQRQILAIHMKGEM